MPPQKELCRNFQRGSCRYGDRCKFLHSNQQQPKSNPFGFGVQNSSSFQSTTPQQPITNPFGFGVQNVPQQNGGTNFGASRQSNAFKPFENKWTRTSSATGGNPNASQQNQNQSQASNHKCTDPHECKKLIAADFEQERPLWKLTCYGHFRHLPCDISGDISYEELRAAAYEDAKRGVPIQSIVERERNLQNSKFMEFENLFRNPYTKQENLAQSLLNPFPSVAPNPSPMTMQNHSPSPFPSFGQPATSIGMGSSISSSPPSNNPFGFGQINNPSQASTLFGSSTTALGNSGGGSSPFPSFGQPATSFGMGSSISSSPPSNNPFGFGQINNPSQASTMFGSSTTASGNSGGGPFGSFSTNTSSFSNSGMNNQSKSQPLTSSQNIMSSETNLQPVLFNGSGQAAANSQSLENTPNATSVGDASIWLKEEWKLGEIPEDVPPDAYIR